MRWKFHNDENIDRTNEKINDGKEFTRPQVFGEVFEEGRSLLRGRLGWIDLSKVFLNGRFHEAEAMYEEFLMDAFHAP